MMGKDSLDCHFEEAESGLFSSTSHVEKKVKLFGFELNPSNNNNNVQDFANSSSCMKLLSSNCADQESVNSSTTILISPNKSKFHCQYCFKEFTNSQALGGHQNAHKKERLKKKKMQLQATKASLSYYLHPFQTNSHSLYDYSSNNSQICFDRNDAESIRFDDRSFSFFPEERRLFTLTQASISVSAPASAATPVGFQLSSNSSSSSLPVFERNPSCKSLDLQLGLN